MACFHYLRMWNFFLVAFNCHINCRSWSWGAPCKIRLRAENGFFWQFESGHFCSVNEWTPWLNHIAWRMPCIMEQETVTFLCVPTSEDSELTLTTLSSLQPSQDRWSTCLVHFDELRFSLCGLVDFEEEHTILSCTSEMQPCCFFFFIFSLLAKGDQNA